MIKSLGNILTQHCYIACPPDISCKCRNQINNQLNVMTELEKVQERYIKLLFNQMESLSMMSKIELGDDVIEEIIKFKNTINLLKK